MNTYHDHELILWIRQGYFQILKSIPFEVAHTMRDTPEAGSDRQTSTEPTDFVNYLPGMPPLSTTPGRVERFLTQLFRRRGGVRGVRGVRRRD